MKRIHVKNNNKKLFFHASSLALLCTPIFLSPPALAAVTNAYVEKFEPVAQDASIPGAYVNNNWGLHQPRITRHTDGSIRLLYLTLDTRNNLVWRLMKRSAAGKWTQEFTGTTTDDVVLMRDARNDRAHVLAWANSVPFLYTSPSFAGSAIPGPWQIMTTASRHYGNAGIARDGTVCLKASRELPVQPLTSVANTEYSCGTYSDAAGRWTWAGFISRPSGIRHAYDYIFPNPEGLPKGMYGASTSDLYKTASDVPLLDPGFGNYVFNGIRFYSTGLNTDASWLKTDNKLSSALAMATARVNGSKVASPLQRLHEGFMDSKGRLFSGYYAEDPSDAAVRGMYVAVNDKNGSTLFQSKWTDLPPYGYTRIFEDSKNRLWLLWTNQGTRATQVRLYPLIESLVNGRTSFKPGKFTDLSAPFNPYSIQGSLYLAVPRGGNDKSLYVDAIYNTCWSSYQTGVNFQNSQCYKSDKSPSQRVFYARIRLPD